MKTPNDLYLVVLGDSLRLVNNRTTFYTACLSKEDVVKELEKLSNDFPEVPVSVITYVRVEINDFFLEGKDDK